MEDDFISIHELTQESISSARRLDFTYNDGENIHEGITSMSIVGYESTNIGKEFGFDEEAHEFFNEYARKMGFSIRKGKVERTRKGVITSKKFFCSCERFKQKDSWVRNVLKERAHIRTGCMARMIIKLQDIIWRITNFREDHNHPLETPSKVYMLRSHRKLKEAQIDRIWTMKKARIKPSLGFEYMCEEAGGRQNVGFTDPDYRYFLRSERMNEKKEGEVQSVIDYLKHKQIEDPSLFYSVQVDNEDKKTNFFWVDGSQ